MTFCHECGKLVVPPSAKFCRHCGASQYEETQLPITPAATPFPESVREPLPVPGDTSPLPPSRQSDLPPLVPPEPVLPEVCKSCGSPITPDEKYCGICGSPLGEHDRTVPHKQEILTSTPSRVCTMCSSPLFETGKFCGICGASSDSVAKPNSQTPLPKINTSSSRQLPQPAAMKACRSCGSSLSDTELFCGICGTPIKSIFNRVSVSQQPDGKTCCNCGKPIRATTRFCGSCGMAVGSK
jgi:predicted amidophosphoribosyltransferase